MKITLAVVTAAFLTTLGGCAASSTPSDDSAPSSTASDLSSATPAKKAIKSAIGFFDGGDPKKCHAIKLTEAPAAVAAPLKKAHADLVKALTGADGFASKESDLSEGTYAIYASEADHTVIAYAFWAYADNGDAGRGMVRGFDPAGHEIDRDEGSWGED